MDRPCQLTAPANRHGRRLRTMTCRNSCGAAYATTARVVRLRFILASEVTMYRRRDLLLTGQLSLPPSRPASPTGYGRNDL